MATNASALQDSAVCSVTFRRKFVAKTFVRMAPRVLCNRQTSFVSVRLVMAGNFAK